MKRKDKLPPLAGAWFLLVPLNARHCFLCTPHLHLIKISGCPYSIGHKYIRGVQDVWPTRSPKQGPQARKGDTRALPNWILKTSQLCCTDIIFTSLRKTSNHRLAPLSVKPTTDAWGRSSRLFPDIKVTFLITIPRMLLHKLQKRGRPNEIAC